MSASETSEPRVDGATSAHWEAPAAVRKTRSDKPAGTPKCLIIAIVLAALAMVVVLALR